MTTDRFDYKIVTDLTENVFNFIFDEKKSPLSDKKTIQFLLEIKHKMDVCPLESISIEVINKIDIQVKKTCIRLVTDQVLENTDPLKYYSSESLSRYKNTLSKILQDQSDENKISWLLNHIIEIIDLQCSEFAFIIFYNKKLLNKFDEIEAKQRTVLALQRSALKAQNLSSEKINDALETVTAATEKANKAANDASQTANEASKKITETSVTVLGMFTGIVITIVAGVLFASSVLGNVAEANFNRLICASALVGFLCFHLIALMFRFIDKFRDPKSDSVRLSSISKLVSLVLIAIIVVSFILQIVFPVECDNHSSNTWVVDKEATCTEEGERYRSCTICKKILETEKICPIGHNYETIIEKQPTCIEKGAVYKKCTVCNDITTSEIIPAIGHNYETTTDKLPTCTDEGLFHKKCITCGEVTTPEVITAVGHNYETIIDKQPTCTEEGMCHKKCTVCGDITVSEAIPKLK